MADIQFQVDSLRRKCLACGRCRRICPSFENDGCDPMEIMVGGESDLSACIDCGKCSKTCRRTDPHLVIRLLREISG